MSSSLRTPRAARGRFSLSAVVVPLAFTVAGCTDPVEDTPDDVAVAAVTKFDPAVFVKGGEGEDRRHGLLRRGGA